MTTENVITAYKGFDENFQCRGMQYAIGQTFKHEGEVKACNAGLHSCENPLDVFSYYPPATSKYAIVEARGAVSREVGGDSKIATAELHIKAQIAIPDLVAAGVKWILGRLNSEIKQTNTGNRSAATNTGNRSAATNTGCGSDGNRLRVESKSLKGRGFLLSAPLAENRCRYQIGYGRTR